MARATNYTDSTELIERISSDGVDEGKTDTSGTSLSGVVNANAITRACERASNKVDFYCLPKGYTVALLATSEWVKDIATDLAVCAFKARRTDSRTSAEKEACAAAIAMLELVFAGRVPIPDLAVPSGFQKIGSVGIIRPRVSEIWPVREIEYDKDESVVHDDADDV